MSNNGARTSSLTPRQRRRAVLLMLFLFLSAGWLALVGVVFERTVVMVWLFLLLLIIVSGDDRQRGTRSVRRLALDWGGFIVLVLLYRYAGALADNLGRPVAMQGLVDFDRTIGFGRTPTERLQDLFEQRTPIPLWQIPLSLVYFSHFFTIPITAAVLWRRERGVWLRFMRSFFTMAIVGVATYAVFPAAPPWMASEEGLIDPVTRSSYFGIERMGLRLTKAVVETGQQWSNPVAAMPSMHAAFALFLAVFFWNRVRKSARFALAAYALSMAFALVLTAEHWISDIVVGWIVAVASIWVWNRGTDKADTKVQSDPAAAPDAEDNVGERRVVGVR